MKLCTFLFHFKTKQKNDMFRFQTAKTISFIAREPWKRFTITEVCYIWYLHFWLKYLYNGFGEYWLCQSDTYFTPFYSSLFGLIWRRHLMKSNSQLKILFIKVDAWNSLQLAWVDFLFVSCCLRLDNECAFV